MLVVPANILHYSALYDSQPYIYMCGVESSLGQSDSSLTTTTLHQTKFNLQFEFDLH